MRLRVAVALSSFCLISGLSRAENLNLNEKPETTSVYIMPYAIGPGLGALYAINKQLQDQHQTFAKISLSQSWRFQENWDVGLDLDWWAPGTNPGGLLNINYVFGSNGMRPFLGLGTGLQYIDDPYPGETNRFGKRFGIEGEAMVGMYIDVTDDTHLRLRVPFQMTANNHTDRVAGLDISLLFSLPTYGTKVKKLKY